MEESMRTHIMLLPLAALAACDSDDCPDASTITPAFDEFSSNVISYVDGDEIGDGTSGGSTTA
jgi:hypothetical protein